MDQSRTPSIASLAQALSRRDETESFHKKRIAIARPSNLTLALLAVTLVLLVVVSAALINLGQSMTDLVAAVRSELALRAKRAVEEIPPGNALLDVAVWRREVAGRPLAAKNLTRTRCQMLAGEKRWEDILSTVTTVRLNSPGDLGQETQILEAEALLQLRRGLEASSILHQLDLSLLDSVWQARASELAGRLWLDAGRSAAAVGK